MFGVHNIFFNTSVNGHVPTVFNNPKTRLNVVCNKVGVILSFWKTGPFQGKDIDLSILSKPADVIYQIKLFYLLMLSGFHLKVRPIFEKNVKGRNGDTYYETPCMCKCCFNE